METIGRFTIIGAGAMGTAFAEGVVRTKIVAPADLTISDTDESQLAKLRTLGARLTTDNTDAARGANVIMLAVKPAVVESVLAEIKAVLTKQQLLISIAAGVRIEKIEHIAPPGMPVIRSMPNTPCRIGQGATGFARGSSASDSHARMAAKIFGSVGIAIEVPETLLNAVTGLSGSGPAYIFMLIEALSDAGVRVGLPRSVALKLAAQTVAGAARMVIEQDEHPARLKDQVTSPGGTTIAGIEALERAGFRSALIEAVKAAAKRAEELG